jgi:hypothetical protein
MTRESELLCLLEHLLSVTESLKDLDHLSPEDRGTWVEISAACADIREAADVSNGKCLGITARVKFIMRHLTRAVESDSYLNAASWTQELLGVLLHGLSKELKKVR